MKLNEWKQNELNRLLMEKFNLKEKHCGNRDEEEDSEEEEDPKDEKESLDELQGGCGCPDKHPGMSHKAYLITLEEEQGDQE